MSPPSDRTVRPGPVGRALRSVLRILRRWERGQALMEFALAFPVLLILLLGIVEFGHAFEVLHGLTGLSREMANIAARGTELDEVVDLALGGGLREQGGVIATRIEVEDGTPRVREQVASAGYAGRSRIGRPGKLASALVGIDLTDGQLLYVVELFHPYEPLTPLARLVRHTVPEELYDRAIF